MSTVFFKICIAFVLLLPARRDLKHERSREAPRAREARKTAGLSGQERKGTKRFTERANSNGPLKPEKPASLRAFSVRYPNRIILLAFLSILDIRFIAPPIQCNI
jgi:hypothetical protein